MTDVFTPEKRSRVMAGIKSKNTKPELVIRHMLFRAGFRYRLQGKKLPGRPDIVLPRWKTVIFVNGCFWHGHAGCRYFHLPLTRKEFWRNKIEGNAARDRREWKQLQNLGWKVIVIWECATRKKTLLPLLQEKILQSIQDQTIRMVELGAANLSAA